MKKSPATYRFAFYGRSGSGKTCLLSALAMSHRPHPDGYTCTRVPLEGDSADAARTTLQHVDDSNQGASARADQDAAEPSQSSALSTSLSERQRGDVWIEEAIEALQRGELPRANQASDFVMTFEYEFTSPDRRTYRIELVDYSGELLNPRDLSDPESLAAQLREHLMEMDGLLVVAEAPRGGETEHLSNELNLLRQAFVSLRGEKQDGPALDMPVGLLVTKWDRQADLTGEPTADEQLQELDQFFESTEHGEYRQLRNDLQNGVTPGNFRAFPVSALGPVELHERDDGREVERPTSQAPLPSFGMEDGFVWAARRCDALALRECEEKSLGLSWLWPPWRAGSGQLSRTAWSLAKRFPRGTQEHQRANSVARTCRLKQLCRGAMTAVTLLMCWMGGEAMWDREAFRQGEAKLADPTTEQSEIATHEQWLDDYASSGAHRHVVSKLFISGDEAYDKVHELRRTRVEKDWKKVAVISDVRERAAAAKGHLDAYPNSAHLEEVREAIAGAEAKDNADWWKLVQADSQQAIDNRQEDSLNSLLKRLDVLPFPNREKDSEHEARMGLRMQVSKVLGEIAAEKEWAQFIDEYNQLLDGNRPLDAGSLLAERVQKRASDERLERTCEQFRTHVAQNFPKELKDLIRLNKWTDARDLVDRLEREQTLWPESMQPESSLQFVATQRKEVDTAYDQHLYEALRRNRTSTAAQDYLDVAPLGAMRSETQDFKKWLATRGESLKLTLVLTRLDWGDGAQHANDNHVTIRFNQKTVGERTRVVSKENTSTGELTRYQFRAKLGDDVKLGVTVKERDFFGYHDDHGRGEQTVRVYDLVRGFTLPLRSDKYYHEAVFHVEGAPPEPELPAWRGD